MSSDDEDSDDPFGGLGRGTTTKRQKISKNDSDDSDSDESDDSLHLGRNRSAELAERRKRLMAKQSTYSSSDSDDSDSSLTSSAAKAKAAKKKPTNNTSDDSDSSISFLGTQSRKNPGRKARSPQKKCSPAKKSSAAAAAGGRKSIDDTCEILSSDDDIYLPQIATTTTAAVRKCRSPRKQAPLLKDTEHHDPSVRKASTKALDDARKAREKLRAAQQYKAKEVEMPAVDLDIQKSSSSSRGAGHGSRLSHMEVVNIDKMITSKPKAAPTIRYTGPTIRLTLRYKNPTTNKVTETSMKIKMDQPIQHIVDEFNTNEREISDFLLASDPKQSSNCVQIASVKFDGQTLNLNKTPSFYEMEDEDMVDVVVVERQRQTSSTSVFGALGSMASRAAATMGVGGGSSTATKSSTVTMTEIHVQTKGQPSQKHNFKLNTMDPLSKVVKAYCEKYQLISLQLEYNGRLLDPKKSPHAEGLPNIVHLDAVGEVGGPSIKLRFRVNGKSNDITSLSIPLKGQFQSVMARFAQKKCVIVSQCKFIFDGEVLNPNATPEGLDLEGDEIIDVTLSESNTTGARINLLAQGLFGGPSAKISIQTNRNRNNNSRQKTWTMTNTDQITTLQTEYVKYYKSKGCKTVRFYFQNSLIQDITRSFSDLGIGNGDMIYAMENGMLYRPV